MNFFKNLIKSVKDQIKWVSRTPSLVRSETRVPVTQGSVVKERKVEVRRKRSHGTVSQVKRKTLRKISRASRRANIRRGYQGART